MQIVLLAFLVGLIISLLVLKRTSSEKVTVCALLALVVCIFASAVCILGELSTKAFIHVREKEKYEENIEIQTKSKETEYELLSLEYSEKLQGWITTGEKGGVCLIIKTERQNEKGELIYEKKYLLYYIKNPNTGEVAQIELNADTTKIFLIKEGETPYLVETVVQQYEIDYNVDPPTTTTYGDPSITYSLYIPKGSIAGDIDITE